VAGLAYSVGGAFVDYLLRRYGAQRFLQFYFAGRLERFAEECQEIFGVDLETLEAEFWADAEQGTREKP
jgi:hypothetical protein